MSSMKDLLSKYSSISARSATDGASHEKKRKLSSSADQIGDLDDVKSKDASEFLKDSGNLSSDGGYRGPPHFLILGAQKAGTMAAVKNMNKHPDVFVYSEPHYFDLGWHAKSMKEYRSMFETAGRGKKILGEKTPELIYVDECADRIQQVCPHAKFLLFLRDPVKRAYSAWNMNRSKGRESRTFDECVSSNLKNLDEYRSYGTAEFHYVQRGLYYDQIQRFLKTFPDRDNFLIVIAEHMIKDPKTQYDRIFKFLGAAEFDFEAEDDHIGSYTEPMDAATEAKLRKFFKPHNERLFQFLKFTDGIPEWDGKSASQKASASANASTSTKADEKSGTLVKSSIAGGGGGGVSRSSSSIASTTVADPSAAAGIDLSKASEVTLGPVTATGSFAEIGRRSGTDKITHHGYHRFYPRFIEHYRSHTGGAMLEIGVDRSNSLVCWQEYFPNAFIYGVDIDIAASTDRYKIFKADQSDHEQMKSVVKDIKHPIFLVIDDGSHIPEHQVSCFDYLFRDLLMPGGTYIIEDIETSYWTRNGLYGYQTNYGWHHDRSCVEIFKDLADDINNEFLSNDARRRQENRVGADISNETRRMVSSITFGHNCIILTKKTVEERSYDDRKYRFYRNL